MIRAGILPALLLILALDPALVAAGRADRPDTVAVSVSVGRPGHVLPRSFLGLSFEYWDLRKLDRNPGLLTRVFELLHVPGNGPSLLRMGGDSADHTYWRERAHPSEFPSYRLGPGFFGRLRGLAERAHLKLLLDLNLAARDPGMAAALVRAAVASLPRHSIESLEVGNEPDVYHREPFYRLAAVADVRLGSRAAWDRYDAARYTSEFTAYSRSVTAAVRRMPLSGPEVANPRLDLSWLQSMVAADRPSLGMLTAHRYPFSACVSRHSRLYPTIGRILSPRATVGEARSAWPAIRLARSEGLPFRITEMNSVTCGGVPGVSNTFATALWAPDALFALLRDGVSGVNVHVRASKVNAAFTTREGRLQARPLLYGLLMFVRALAGDSQLVGTRIHSARKVNVAVWAVRNGPGRLEVLALDKAGRPIRLTVAAPAAGPATVQRLMAPSVRATTGETLAGQTLGATGRWVGRLHVERLSPIRGGYRLTLPAYSGALLSIRSTPTATRPPPAPPVRRTGRTRATRPAHREAARRAG